MIAVVRIVVHVDIIVVHFDFEHAENGAVTLERNFVSRVQLLRVNVLHMQMPPSNDVVCEIISRVVINGDAGVVFYLRQSSFPIELMLGSILACHAVSAKDVAGHAVKDFGFDSLSACGAGEFASMFHHKTSFFLMIRQY
jgi:hypothetical protein